jgi:hypothetical protein
VLRKNSNGYAIEAARGIAFIASAGGDAAKIF